MHRLLNIGFKKVGDWQIVNQKPIPVLIDLDKSSNILYAFVCEGNVCYVGKTVRPLKSRMYNYKNPGASQTTNIIVRKNINISLNNGKKIDIYALPDSGLLSYGDFHLNLAASLEDSIIRILNPPWNGSDKNQLGQSCNNLTSTHVNTNMTKKNTVLPEKSHVDCQNDFNPKIGIKLGEAYYNQGFFNITRKYDKHIGKDGDLIDICFFDTDVILNAKINRTANANCTARIMGGKILKNWIQSRFVKGDVLGVEILSKNSIKLVKKEK